MNPYTNQANNVPKQSSKLRVGQQIMTTMGPGIVTDIRGKIMNNSPNASIHTWLVTITIPGHGIAVLQTNNLVFTSGVGGAVSISGQFDSIL